MAKAKKRPVKYLTISVRFSPDKPVEKALYQVVKKRAEENGRTLSSEVVQILKDALKE